MLPLFRATDYMRTNNLGNVIGIESSLTTEMNIHSNNSNNDDSNDINDNNNNTNDNSLAAERCLRSLCSQLGADALRGAVEDEGADAARRRAAAEEPQRDDIISYHIISYYIISYYIISY